MRFSNFIILLLLSILMVSFFACQNSINTFTDPRDQQTYRTKEILGQTWMLDNLQFQTDSSWCYKNEAVNCPINGRLYTWYDGMKACPEGWRLPTQQEWMDLALHIAGEEWHEVDGGQNRLYRKLKPESDYDFVLPLAGMYDPELNSWFPLGSVGSYWSSTKFAFHAAVCAVLDKTNGEVFMINPGTRTVGHSCRCIKD